MTTIFKTPFATQGDKASIPVEIQPDGSVSYTQGYGYDYERDQVTDPAAKDIEREKMNGIFHDITEAIGEIQRFGFPKWDEAGKPYAIRTIVYHKNKVWQSKVENNNIEPVAGNAWAELKADATASDVGAYSKGESDKRFQPLGNYTPSGYSYSKAETDTKYQPKGNYAPAGNYANKGDSYTKTESDGRYQAKGSYQPSGDYATNSALNSGLNNKFDKGNVAQSTGTSTVHVMSQKASTDAFQPKGNYQPAGNYALVGASYTKAESDGKYQPKGSYQASGYSYSKSESDGKYQPKGNYATAGSSYTKAESDGRYNKKQKIFRRVDSITNPIETGNSIDLKEDVRGKYLYVAWERVPDLSMSIIPADNIKVCFNDRSTVYIVLYTTNNGKKLHVERNSNDKVTQIHLFD